MPQKLTKIQMMLFVLSLTKTAVIPPIAPENENHIKLMENLKNIHILTTVAETNLVILVFQKPLQQKP